MGLHLCLLLIKYMFYLLFSFIQESGGFSLIDVSKEVQEVALLVDHSKGVVDNVLSFFEDLFQNFSVIPDLRVNTSSYLALYLSPFFFYDHVWLSLQLLLFLNLYKGYSFGN